MFILFSNLFYFYDNFSVHCELLGTNTKNNSDSRAANMQDRLRKKLKKRQQEAQQLKKGYFSSFSGFLGGFSK